MMGMQSGAPGWGLDSRCRANWRRSMAAQSVCTAMGRDSALSFVLTLPVDGAGKASMINERTVPVFEALEA